MLAELVVTELWSELREAVKALICTCKLAISTESWLLILSVYVFEAVIASASTASAYASKIIV